MWVSLGVSTVNHFLQLNKILHEWTEKTDVQETKVTNLFVCIYVLYVPT